jgi:hypothetical protein
MERKDVKRQYIVENQKEERKLRKSLNKNHLSKSLMNQEYRKLPPPRAKMV